MVNVKEQQEFEIIIPERRITSKECPFIIYPINIYGCNHPSNRKGSDYEECNPNICPFHKPKVNSRKEVSADSSYD